MLLKQAEAKPPKRDQLRWITGSKWLLRLNCSRMKYGRKVEIGACVICATPHIQFIACSDLLEVIVT
ncbi:MAG: hypothetical protein J0G94_18395 [Sphingomonadales bacterium]|nr:hypothetical protein [Sphingomonadales bacterium]